MNPKFVLLKGSQRARQKDASRIGDVDPKSQIEVTLSLKGPELPGADNLPAKPLTREQLAANFGANAEDADRVSSVLKRYGIKTDEVSLISRSMRVSGPAGAIEKAFQSKLGLYHNAKQGDFRGREGKIGIPAELAGIVTGVFGLDERRVARRHAVRSIAAAPAPGPSPLTPSDLEDHYNFPAGGAKGQQVAIAEFEGGYFADDLKAFCAKYGRPMPKVETVSVGLSSLTLAQIQQLPPAQRNEELGASMEVNMDVQIIASLCSEAQVFVYFAPFTQKGWVDLLNKVMSGNPAQPVALSISWGLPEDDPDWSQAALNAINTRLQAAALMGITVCVSSGDDGSGDQINDGHAHVNFPASSPFVLSVGGTMLLGPPAHAKEEVWWESPGRRTNKGGGATGGGVSVFFDRPQWQNVKIPSLNKKSIDGRVLPDIAALAGPPLYDLIFMGRDFPDGGTSASAPLWASLIARMQANRMGKPAQFLTPLLYQKGPSGVPRGQAASMDVTVGNNASHPQPGVGYKARKGFDAVTGWGVPDGQKLLSQLP